MATVEAHYDELLADIYSWMAGDFDLRVDAQVAWLRGVIGEASGRALDLGCGPGAEAIALARLGYDVVAVDTSAKLVAEARTRADAMGHRVEVVQADLVTFLEQGEHFDVATCLGDTLTHLDSPLTVQRVLRAARACAECLVLTYRDLSNELHGLDRFFQVRADDRRCLTCFVEYFPGHAMIHDLVQTRTTSGWEMRKSSYAKLRLPVSDVMWWLTEAGFAKVERVPASGGLVALVAR